MQGRSWDPSLAESRGPGRWGGPQVLWPPGGGGGGGLGLCLQPLVTPTGQREAWRPAAWCVVMAHPLGFGGVTAPDGGQVPERADGHLSQPSRPLRWSSSPYPQNVNFIVTTL